MQAVEGHWIRLSFSDGAVKDVDVSGLLEAGGVFAPIRDSRELFEQVRVTPETQTVEWPGMSTSTLTSFTAVTSLPPASGSNVGSCGNPARLHRIDAPQGSPGARFLLIRL